MACLCSLQNGPARTAELALQLEELERTLVEKECQLDEALADKERQLAESLTEKARHRQLADALADRARQLEEALADRTRELAEKGVLLEEKERQLAASRAREAELVAENRGLQRRDTQEETSQLARQLADSVQLSRQLERQLERAEHDRAVILGTLLPLLADHGLHTNPSSARDVATSLKRLVLDLHARAAAAPATRGAPLGGTTASAPPPGTPAVGAPPVAPRLPPLAVAPRSEQGRGSGAGLETLGEGGAPSPWGGVSSGPLGREGEKLEGGHYSAPFGPPPISQRWLRGAPGGPPHSGSEAGGNLPGSLQYSTAHDGTHYSNSNAAARTTPSTPMGTQEAVFDPLGQPRDGSSVAYNSNIAYNSGASAPHHSASALRHSYAPTAPPSRLSAQPGQGPGAGYVGGVPGHAQGVGSFTGAEPVQAQGGGGFAGGVPVQAQGVAYEERGGAQGAGLPLERTRSDLAAREATQWQR